MTAEPVVSVQGVREITDEETEAYQRDGWALLRGFVAPELVSDLLAHVKRQMGEEAENEVRDTAAGAYQVPSVRKRWRNWEDPWKDDEFISRIAHSREMGRAGSKLLGGRAVRFWSDEVLCKMPVSKGGGPTLWHTDWPYHSMDRAGILNLWIALVDVPPEKGSLRFYTGSHRMGPIGRVIQRTDGKDTLDDYPEITEQYECSPPLDLKAGDATVHNLMTVHSAGANHSDSPRWVYLHTMFPADALYTGADQRRTNDLGLEINGPFEHENFPLMQT